MMTDLLICIALILILGGAGYYIYREKRSGKKCIGCPYADSCHSQNDCNT